MPRPNTGRSAVKMMDTTWEDVSLKAMNKEKWKKYTDVLVSARTKVSLLR